MADNDLCETPQPTQQSVLNRTSKDKFLLVLNLPPILQKDKTIKINPLQLSIFGTIVPTIQVPSNEVRFAGQSINVSSHARPNYTPLPVNFIVDNNFQNYWVLWKWLDALNTARQSLYAGSDFYETILEDTGRGTLLEYQSNFSVISLNEYNQPLVNFSFYNAFITSLGSIEYKKNK